MARIAAVIATVRLVKVNFCRAHCIMATCEVAEMLPIVRQRHAETPLHMDFMVAVRLCIFINIVTSHDFLPVGTK